MVTVVYLDEQISCRRGRIAQYPMTPYAWVTADEKQDRIDEANSVVVGIHSSFSTGDLRIRKSCLAIRIFFEH